jgi:hypothetical protein
VEFVYKVLLYFKFISSRIKHHWNHSVTNSVRYNASYDNISIKINDNTRERERDCIIYSLLITDIHLQLYAIIRILFFFFFLIARGKWCLPVYMPHAEQINHVAPASQMTSYRNHTHISVFFCRDAVTISDQIDRL